MSFISINNEKQLPVTSILDGVILFILFYNFKGSINKQFRYIFIFTLLYLVLSLCYVFFHNGVNLGLFIDFIYNFKSFYYLLIYIFIINYNIFDSKFINLFYKILLFFFFLKYLISYLFVGIDSRPILFIENNYELVLLASICYLDYVLNGNNFNWWMLFFTSLVFVLGKSNSGIIIWFFVSMSMIYYRHGFFNFNLKKLFTFIFIVCCVLFVLALRFNFSDNIEYSSIDRFSFLSSFLFDTKDWSFFNYLLGSERITPVSSSTAYSLGFYENLFSKENPVIAYSVIYHSFILRMIYDHGVILLIFMFYILYLIFNFKGYTKVNSLTFVLIFLLSGFSVSSLNSSLSAFSIVLILCCYFPRNLNIVNN